MFGGGNGRGLGHSSCEAWAPRGTGRWELLPNMPIEGPVKAVSYGSHLIRVPVAFIPQDASGTIVNRLASTDRIRTPAPQCWWLAKVQQCHRPRTTCQRWWLTRAWPCSI